MKIHLQPKKEYDKLLKDRVKQTEFYVKRYGYMPWTITIADALEAGLTWDTTHIAKVLRDAQKQIDEAPIKEEK
jgi:uncharacterized membrane protein